MLQANYRTRLKHKHTYVLWSFNIDGERLKNITTSRLKIIEYTYKRKNYDICWWNADPCLGQAHTSNGVKPVNGISKKCMILILEVLLCSRCRYIIECIPLWRRTNFELWCCVLTRLWRTRGTYRMQRFVTPQWLWLVLG